MKWLDDSDWTLFIFVCVLLTFAPIYPQPHLFEQLTLVRTQSLNTFSDIVDLCMHLAPSVLLITKAFRQFLLKP